MIRTKLLITAALLLFSEITYNQEAAKDNRTVQTRIADLLAQLPASDPGYLAALMNTMAGLGEDGLVEMAGMLTPTGKGNDAAVRYALGGFSNYVMIPGQDENRLLCQKAWCRALEDATDPEIKAFLIAQLQVAGSDMVVPCLEKYLLVDQLCDPAARALAVINTPKAGSALYNVLSRLTGPSQISIVEALGNMSFAEAEPGIALLANSPDPSLRKVSLYALARFGMPKSTSLLYDAALKSGFVYEPVMATSSYLLWINRLIENGQAALAEKQCLGLLKSCSADNQVQTRSEALSLLVKATGDKATRHLYDAIGSNNPQYRAAALNLALQLKGEEQTLGWIKKSGKMKGQTKAEIITMLGERGDPAALPTVLQCLQDEEESVRLSAIVAAAQLGRESILASLLGVLKKDIPVEVVAAKEQMLTFGGNSFIPAIASALPDMPAHAKTALIEILAARGSAEQAGLVMDQTGSPESMVRLAAFSALPALVSSKDLDQLFALVPRIKGPEETAAWQSGVVAAVRDLPADRQTNAVITTQQRFPETDYKLLYGIFSGIGNDQALQATAGDFRTGKSGLKEAAFKALADWKYPNAIRELYDIGLPDENAAYRETALKSCIRLIHNSDYPDDQRLLLLRKVMELAASSVEKSLILRETATCNTYLALRFAARYLDDPALQQDAARAVSAIALENESLLGDDIRELLNKSMNILSGPESEYQKEAIRKHLAAMPAGAGFVPLFNGIDLSGWKGLVENPVVRASMKPSDLAKAQVRADEIMLKGWKVENGILVFTGEGENLCTTRSYGDFEMIVDWKITPRGDAGIYLRGSPQVQIWDTSRRDAGAQVGSGGLYNNGVHERNPLKVADNAVGDWNTFRIIMQGERVTVYLNGVLVVDHVIMENYWDRSIPIFPAEQIELQAHGTWVGYRDIFIREIPRPEPYRVSEEEKTEGFVELFDGLSMFNWTGNTKDYVVENGCIAIYPKYGGKGNLYTKAEYSDFIFRFEFQLTPGANNGIGIRTPMEGDAAYAGMEIQVLDNTAEIYRNLKEYQYHGSVYGVIPAKREYLKPVGEWNSEEILAQGSHIRVTLNGIIIVDGDIAEAAKNGTLDHREHPGLLNTTGHIGFLGHGSEVKFRNLRIKDLTK